MGSRMLAAAERDTPIAPTMPGAHSLPVGDGLWLLSRVTCPREIPRSRQLMRFHFTDWPGRPARLSLCGSVPVEAIHVSDLVILAERSSLRCRFGWLPRTLPASYHLDPALRRILLDIRDAGLAKPFRETYRTGKALELLSRSMSMLASDQLLPTRSESDVNARLTAQLIRAREVIDKHWRGRLTIEDVAVLVGVNRTKLTTGYRSLFGMSVAEAIAERRFAEILQLLVTTDLRMAEIGYRGGYENHASFTRAFARRFGCTPNAYRLQRSWSDLGLRA